MTWKLHVKSLNTLLKVEPLAVEVDHFLDCIRNGTPCLTGPDHAREVVRILDWAKA